MGLKIVPAIVITAVAVILVGALLMPVIQDYDDDVKVVKNNVTNNLASVVGEDHTITYTHSTGALSIDGEAVALTSQTGIICSNQMNIIYNTAPNLQLFSSQHTTGVVSITSDATIVIEGNKITITYSTDTVEEYSCDWIYLYDVDGDYGIYRLYNQNKTVYLNDLNQMYGSNILTTTNDWFSFVGKDVKLAVGESPIIADVTTGSVAGTNKIISVNIGSSGTGYQFDVDNSGEPYTVHPWIYVVPNEVVGYSDMNNQIVPLMYALPVLIIVAILVGVLMVVLRSRQF